MNLESPHALIVSFFTEANGLSLNLSRDGRWHLRVERGDETRERGEVKVKLKEIDQK